MRSRSTRPLRAAAILIVATFALCLLPAGEQGRAATATGRSGDVYLLRGFMNVFSQGMDTLAVKLRDKGFVPKVVNHSAWSAVVAEIAARHEKSPEPVFLIGHSLGADAVILVAERLAQLDVPVALAVTFDPVHPRPAPANVKRFVNFYQSNNGFGTPVRPGPGFRAQLVNVDLKDRPDIGHASIDKEATLHTKVIEEMTRLSRPVRRQSTQ